MFNKPPTRHQRLHRSVNKLTAGSGQFLNFPTIEAPVPALVSAVEIASDFEPGAEIITEVYSATVTKTFLPFRPENHSNVGYLGKTFRIDSVSETENSYTFKIANP